MNSRRLETTCDKCKESVFVEVETNIKDFYFTEVMMNIKKQIINWSKHHHDKA